MSELLYLRRKPCGCVSVAAMVDDTRAEDLVRYADWIAQVNRGEPGVERMERKEWDQRMNCATHGEGRER